MTLPQATWPILLLLAAWTATPLDAHTFAPSLLELRQGGEHTEVRWKQPAVRAMGSELRPVLPAGCQPVNEPAIHPEGTGMVLRWDAQCADGLAGQTIAVEGIAGSRADVLVRIELADGRSLRHILTADRPVYVVPERENVFDVMAGYARLGVEHILSGFDHLLFVLGLVLLVEGRRRLVLTVTAFTAGHSVTLALAVLGVVNMPSGPTEAAIALSIYVLAVELTRRRQDRETWMQRSPWTVAGLFGLLHGLGFAGALSEIGLPAGEIPAALLAFNLGIEAGQLAFVAVVLTCGWALRAAPVHWPARLAHAPAYVIGSLAAFWFLERIL